MKRKVLCAVILAALMTEAVVAQEANSNSNSVSGAVSGSASYGNVGNSTTNTMNPTANSNATAVTGSNSTSNNAGNSQTINFNSSAGGTREQPAVSEQRITGGTSNTNTNVTRMEGGTTSVNRLEGETTQRIEYSGTQTIKNVPSVNGPPLTTSNDTCMGSTSGSINGAGFGIGLGSTWTDRNCVMLKNARELWNMGMKAAAMALICGDENNRAALEVTGFVCPQTAAAQRTAQVEAEKEALKKRVAELEAAQSKRRSWFSRAEPEVPPPAPIVEAAPVTSSEPVAVATPVVESKVETIDKPVLIRVVSDPK